MYLDCDGIHPRDKILLIPKPQPHFQVPGRNQIALFHNASFFEKPQQNTLHPGLQDKNNIFMPFIK
jgi:hypothetical protein